MLFFDELKRRNVFRVAAAYIVIAWLVIQVVETIAPSFGYGDGMIRGVVILAAIGLIPVVVLAWAFELTPEGLKRDKDVDRSQPTSESTGKTLDHLIMVVLALALGYFAFDKFVLSPERESELQKLARQAGVDQALEAVRQGLRNDKSIAVLPFINRSERQEDEYFTDGIHDELLTRLSHISVLRVISRTSVMRYRDSNKSLPEIARELSVANILEGGVQRSGDQVRINVQLINAHTDEHLWAQTFDRELTAENLFGIQTEISKAIAEALQAELTPESVASIEEVATDNAEAYDLYLQAIQERHVFLGSETFEAMKPLLERAVALDPDFLRAQVLLLETYGRLLWTGADPNRIYGARALELATDIRRRWPDRVEGHLALGHYHYSVERDYERALEAYRIFEAVYPNDVEVLRSMSASLKRSGRFEEQLRYARRLAALDPENSNAVTELLYAFRFNGLVEETLAMAEEGVERFPEDPGWRRDLATYRLIYLGDVEGFLAYGERLREQDRWFFGGSDLSWLLYGQGELETALEHVATRMRGDYGWGQMTDELDRALILRAAGRDDEAQAAADHALGFVRSWIDSDRHFPDTRTRYWYTWAAYSAAIAGDADAAKAYRANAESAPMDGFLMDRLSVMRDSRADALLGDPEAGWARLAPYMGNKFPLLTPEYAAAHPLHEYLFGSVAAYQEFVANAALADTSNQRRQ